MIVFEGAARWILGVHLIAAAVLVGAATHHVIWARSYLRRPAGEISPHRVRAERRFALIVAITYVITFILGNCLYPVYKVRVRAEYFDTPSAVGEEARWRAEKRRELGLPPGGIPPKPLVAVARVFDIKEHAVALGVAAALGLLILSRRAHPSTHADTLALYLGLSWFVCGTAWMGALIGIWTASHRSVAGLG